MKHKSEALDIFKLFIIEVEYRFNWKIKNYSVIEDKSIVRELLLNIVTP